MPTRRLAPKAKMRAQLSAGSGLGGEDARPHGASASAGATGLRTTASLRAVRIVRSKIRSPPLKAAFRTAKSPQRCNAQFTVAYFIG